MARTEESSPVAKVNFRPLLLVEIDGRPASVQLKQLPSRRGWLRIRYENDATEAEVEASRCMILALEDGGKAVPLVGADAEAARAPGWTVVLALLGWGVAQVRSLPKPALARPPPTRQTARKWRLNFLYLESPARLQ